MSKHKYRKLISRKVTKAILHYDMIKPNDRILVAVSGGKDSITLLKDLAARQQNFFIPYTIEAVHIESDFCNCCKKVRLEEQVEGMGIKYHTLKVPIMGRLKPGKKMNCYWCSMQRRLELLKFAEQNGFHKVALGHHMDDIVETLFMNMFTGKIATMPPKFVYTEKPLELIRPLAFVEEQDIIAYMEEIQLSKLVCNCPYGVNSERKILRKKINTLIDGNSTTKRKIFESMSNIDENFLA